VASGLAWLERSRTSDVLTDDFARNLHKKLFGEVWRWAGTFRRTEKNIGIDPLYIGVQLRGLLDDARYWLDHDIYAPLEAAMRLHHRMVYIHPFPNGNGRHARIMADALLTKMYGHNAIDWAGGYDLQKMNERRAQYLTALRAADAGDYAPLLAFTGAE
jgi:Fic-DOC domain mobile mystery protein B